MKILAMVLAGGNGSRLHPLTAEHAKPALPFAQGHRIIDFVLSNLVNSDVSRMHVLVQYKPQSLITHIHTAWTPWSAGTQPAITIGTPETGSEGGAFKGTANAIYQNLHLIDRERPDLVAVFAADHVYRMDVRQMVRFHQERGAEVSVAATPVPLEKASAFGIMVTGSAGELRDFQEKPERATPMPTDSGRALASMGNYLFNPRALRELLEEANQRGDTDFGSHILPRLPHSRRVFAYDFSGNKVPGVRPHEERGYWRDIGTLDAYQAALNDVLGPSPCFSLENAEWPIHGVKYAARRNRVLPAAKAPARTPPIAAGESMNAPLRG